jgi:hypothetical protein
MAHGADWEQVGKVPSVPGLSEDPCAITCFGMRTLPCLGLGKRRLLVFTTLQIAAAMAWVTGALTTTAGAQEEVAPGVVQTGTIQSSAINESSGLIASRRFPEFFWTHNDGGGTPRLFAISRDGRVSGTFEVTGANIEDWEDIELDGANNLYIADIGNNDSNRERIRVFKLREPRPFGSGSVPVMQEWSVRFPGRPFDSEAFLVQGRFGYLIAKELEDEGAPVYRFPLVSGRSRAVTLSRVGHLPVESMVTGADLSANGRRLGLITDGGAYVFSARRNALTAKKRTASFTPFALDQMEGGSFAGDGFLVSAESGELLLFDTDEFRVR